MSTHRSAPAQQPPPGSLVLASAMPRSDIEGVWFREHADRAPASDRGCWCFTHTPVGKYPGGRFDLAHPRGTCYLGSSLGVAARERCGRLLAIGLIPEGHVAGRVVSTVRLPPTQVADLTHPDGARLGVTAELATGHDYALTAAWANALDSVGLGGIRYAPRFTPAGGPEHAAALFGAAGAHPHAHPVLTTRTLAQVLADLGYPTLSPPSASQLHISTGPPP